jgi:glycosyltransferase involved in cell wall biosynthesis
MRVLRVLSTLDPSTGGPVSVFGGAVKSTVAAGAKVECLTLSPRQLTISNFPDYQSFVDRGITVHGSPNLAHASLQLWRLSKRFDIVHVDGCWQPLCVIAILIAKVAGLATVVTPHETLTEEELRRTKSPVRFALKRALRYVYFKWADCIVYSSALECNDSLRHSHAIIIPHPVFDDTDGARPAVIRGGFASRGPIHLGYLGRFHPKKKLEDIVADSVRTPGVRLFVAGGGPGDYEKTIKTLANGSDKITWLGFLHNDRKEEFFRSIDFLVLASEYECFGMAAAEALARGIPVIVSRRTGVADDVENAGAGFVVDGGTDSLMRTFVACSAMTQVQYSELQNRALNAAASYSFSSHGRKQLSAYRLLLQADPR